MDKNFKIKTIKYDFQKCKVTFLSPIPYMHQKFTNNFDFRYDFSVFWTENTPMTH